MLKRIDPFIALLLASVALAMLAPISGRPAELLDNLVTIMIVLLFFFQGVRLPRAAVMAALAHWRLHLAIVMTTFVLFPLLGLGLRTAMPGALSPDLWTGLLFMCALPSTVQSSVAFTSIARGNVAAAVTAAAGSNIIGVVIAPLILALMLATHGGPGIDISSIGRLVLLLLVPFVVGQILAPYVGAFIGRHKRLTTLNDRGLILLAVYGAFSEATMEKIWAKLPSAELLFLTLFCVAILAFVMLANWRGGQALGFNLPDRIALLMCGSKKSLASGVPMASVLFHGPVVGVILLPIMIFHLIQLLVCAVVARRLVDDEQASSPSGFSRDPA